MIDKETEIMQDKMVKLMSENLKKYHQLEFDFSNKPKIVEGLNVKKSCGETCKSCNVFYPYADPNKEFKCWSCKNF